MGGMKAEDLEMMEKLMAKSAEQLKKKLEQVKKKKATLKTQLEIKNETKTVSLGTSKINYIDPRITVAWCKHVNLPVEKVFNKSLLKKFPWAFTVDASWKF